LFIIFLGSVYSRTYTSKFITDLLYKPSAKLQAKP